MQCVFMCVCINEYEYFVESVSMSIWLCEYLERWTNKEGGREHPEGEKERKERERKKERGGRKGEREGGGLERRSAALGISN